MLKKPDETIYTTRGKYLRRWWLRKRGPGRVRVYLHNAVDSDDDRALHDHIGDNLSIILRGGYIEHVFAYPPVDGQPLPPVIQKKRRPGSVVFRRAELAHRLELYHEAVRCPVTGGKDYVKQRPCWSLFITWPKSREWGFWCQRPGIVGEIPVPRGDDTLVLQFPGQVASWVHHTGFLEKVGCP